MALQKTPTTPAPARAAIPTPSAKPPAMKKKATASTPFWIGLGVSLGWVAMVLAVIAKAGATHSLGGVALADWAVGVCAAVSPVAMVWMVTAYLQRAADIQSIADPLRRQLTLITGESGAADARIRRFNQALREQIELLRSAQTLSEDDLEAVMDRVRQHRSDFERFENVSGQQVREIQDVIRRSMLQIEQMMDDKFTMLRVLDGKLQQNGDGVARQVEGVGEQVAKLLEDIERTSASVADTLDRAQRDSQKLADTSRLQGSSLTSAAESASETLGGLSSKIDLSVTRFLERASSAREEAERLAHALDAQTRALDDFSSTLPARVSEAESVLRGVADRLYASEQMAREQAVNLSEKLAQQVDGLQSFMDRFTGRLSDIDTGLDRRHADLQALGERIGATTTHFIGSWEESLTKLNDRTGHALNRFGAVNEETRRNAEALAAHLGDTTAKYEDAVSRLRAMSVDGNLQLKGMTEEIARQLAQFEALNKASNQAGEEVQQRAATAMQNLQHVLERVLAAREATQAVGETLVKDIYAAVDQNEKMIARLAETAQSGTRAITIAADNLGRQESELAGKARHSETSLIESVQKLQQQAESAGTVLRAQTDNLMKLLAETQSQLVVTDQKLQTFATQAVAPVQKAVQQIDASTEQGLGALGRYGEGLSVQVTRLQDFHTRIGGMSADVGKATGESAAALESLSARFTAARAEQEQAARQTLAQFSDLSDRLQRETAGLDGQAAHAVDILQQAALKVGEQSYQMMENAQNSGAQIKNVATTLQAEAAQIQSILRQQSEEISGDLARAEQKFTNLGENIRQRADAAYALIDRVAAQYNDATQRLDDNVAVAQSRVDGLHVALVRQSEQIASDAVRLSAQASEITAGSDRATQSLSALNDKMTGTQQVALTTTQAMLTALNDSSTTFQRRTADLAQAAEGATEAVAKATGAFGEQTGKLIDSSHQIDALLRQMTAATATLTDQSAQIRAGMEQQNNRLLTQLADSVAQMDVTGNKLQQIVAVATQGVDQAGTRFADFTETASRRIGVTTQDLSGMAERAESTLAALGANVAQQAASLSVVGEQIGAQQKALAAANENQRAQMTELFDKLGAAHAQASEIAERSIAYLTDSLQNIHRQLGVVGDRSQEAVGVVKLASVGFSEQAVLLVQNAQAAEQQARAVLSVTSALQEQARHLRESLQSESDRAGETLGALLSRLTTGGGDLREMGDSTGATLANLQRAMAQQTIDMNAAMQQIGDRQRSLTGTLDQQREAITHLINRLTLAQDETAATAERVALRLADNAQHITRQAEAIDARAQNALAAVTAATSGFAEQAGLLNQHSQQAEQQARGVLSVTAGLQEQGARLRDAMQADTARVVDQLSSVIAQLDTAGRQLKNDSASAIDMLDHTAQRFTATATAGVDMARTQTEVLAQTADQAESRLATVGEKMRNHLRLVGDAGDQAEMQARQVADAAEFATTRLVNLRETLIANDREGRDIVDMASQRIEDVKTTLQAQVRSLSDLSQQAAAQIAGAAQNLAAQSDSLRGNLAASESAVGAAADVMREEARDLPASLSRGMVEIETAARSLKNHASEVDQSLVGTADRFISVTAAARNAMVDELERVGSVAEDADKILRHFSDMLAEQVAAMQKNTLTLSLEQKELVEKAERSVGALAEAGERLSTLRGEAAVTAERMARDFDMLDQRASASATRLAQAGEGLTQNMEAIAEVAARAEGNMAGASSGLRDQLERIRAGLQEQIDDINRGLMQITAQLERTGSSLRSTTVGAVADVERIGQRFEQTSGEAAVQLEARTRQMQNATQEVAKLLAGFGDRFEVVLAQMAGAGDGIKRQEGDALKHLQSMLAHLSTVAAKLEEARTLSGDVSQHAIERLDDVVNAVQAQMNTMATGAQTAAGIMRGIGQIYSDQTQALTKGVGDAHNQVLTMNKSIDDMQDRTARLRAGLKLQGDELMNSLRQIMTQIELSGDGLTDAVNRTLMQQAAELKKIG